MAGTASSKIATIIVVLPLLVLAYFLAPLVMPVWRWRNLDFPGLAKQFSLPEKELAQEYKVVIRYQPRIDDDPCGWQIISMDPQWVSTSDKHADEDHVLVRCCFISDRDGTPPSKLFLGSGGPAGFKDRYWKAIVWRFPKGAFGFNRARPLLVYRGDSLEKLSIAEADSMNTEIGGAFGGSKFSTDENDVDDGVKQ